jgi:hypothetical protein
MVHSSADLFESLEAGRKRRTEVVSEILVEQVRNAIDVVLVLEGSGELPDDLLVAICIALLLSCISDTLPVRSCQAIGQSLCDRAPAHFVSLR